MVSGNRNRANGTSAVDQQQLTARVNSETIRQAMPYLELYMSGQEAWLKATTIADLIRAVHETCFAIGRVVGEYDGDIIEFVTVWSHIVSNILESHRTANTFNGPISSDTETFILDHAAEAMQHGYATADNIVIQRYEAQQREYFDGLAAKHESDIWQTTDRGAVLIEGAVARAVQQEIHLMATEKPNGRPQFYRYSEERAHWLPISDLVVQRYVRYIIGNDSSRISANRLRSIAAIVAQDVLMDDDGSKDENYINLSNGVFDLKRYILLPHDHKYGFRYRNSYQYDPLATCPQFDEQLFLYSRGDVDWIKAFWEIVGASLTAENPYQKMFWWLGSGGNGKGTCLRIITELVGRQMVLSGFTWDKLGDRFFLNSVVGKRVAICGDASKEMRNADALKQLTGGDIMSTDVKYGDQRDIEIKSKLIIALNRMPRVETGESLYAIERRIHLLPWDYTIPQDKLDPEIETRLLSELPGIFNRAVDGLQRLRRQGNRFTKVSRGDRRVKGWLKNLNLFQAFVNERCVVDRNDKNIGCFAVDLWASYVDYMDTFAESAWKVNPRYVTNAKSFTSRLRDDFNLEAIERYRPGEKRGTYTYLFGIRLMNQEDIERSLTQARQAYDEMISQMPDQAREWHDAAIARNAQLPMKSYDDKF